MKQLDLFQQAQDLPLFSQEPEYPVKIDNDFHKDLPPYVSHKLWVELATRTPKGIERVENFLIDPAPGIEKQIESLCLVYGGYRVVSITCTQEQKDKYL